MGYTFDPPLYLQRHHLVMRVLSANRCLNIIDAGCASGELLGHVLTSQLVERSFRHVVAIDVSPETLQEVERCLPNPTSTFAEFLHPMTIELVRGDLTIPPPILKDGNSWLQMDTTHSIQSLRHNRRRISPNSGSITEDHDSPETNSAAASARRLAAIPLQPMDAVITIEVIEHIPPHLVAAYTDTIFAQLAAARGARVVLMTTPNRDENKRFDLPDFEGSMDTVCSVYSSERQLPRRRHPGHFFELTAQQFRCYCEYVMAYYGDYWTSYELVGLGDNFTQGAIFRHHPPKGVASTVSTAAAPTSRSKSIDASSDDLCEVGGASSEFLRSLSCDPFQGWSRSTSWFHDASAPPPSVTPLHRWNVKDVRMTLRRGRVLQESRRHRAESSQAVPEEDLYHGGERRATVRRRGPSRGPLSEAVVQDGGSHHCDPSTAAGDAGSVVDSEPPVVRWRWSREERLKGFPFEEVFGVSRADYDVQFPAVLRSSDARLHTEVATQQADPQRVASDGTEVATSAAPYESVQCITFPAVPLWDRLGGAIYRAAQNRFRDLRQASPARRVSPVPHQQFHGAPMDLTRDESQFGCLVLERECIVSQQPLRCTVRALIGALLRQRDAWQQAFQEDLRRWSLFAKPRRIPPESAFTLVTGISDAVMPSRNSTGRGAAAREWPEAQSSNRIVKPHSAAHKALQGIPVADQKEGLQLLRALRVSQSGLRVHEWLVPEVIRLAWKHRKGTTAATAPSTATGRVKAPSSQPAPSQPRSSLNSSEGSGRCQPTLSRGTAVALSPTDGISNSSALSFPSLATPLLPVETILDDDTTLCSEFITEEVILVILFMAAVDVLPGAMSWMKRVVPRWRVAHPSKTRRRCTPLAAGCPSHSLAARFSTFPCSAQMLEGLFGSHNEMTW